MQKYKNIKKTKAIALILLSVSVLSSQDIKDVVKTSVDASVQEIPQKISDMPIKEEIAPKTEIQTTQSIELNAQKVKNINDEVKQVQSVIEEEIEPLTESVEKTSEPEVIKEVLNIEDKTVVPVEEITKQIEVPNEEIKEIANTTEEEIEPLVEKAEEKTTVAVEETTKQIEVPNEEIKETVNVTEEEIKTPKVNVEEESEVQITKAPTQTPKEILQATKETPVKETAQKIQTLKPKVPQTRELNIRITMPKVPKPPQVTVIVPKLILLDSDGKLIPKDSMDSLYKKEEHIFSNRVAPDRFNQNVEHKKEVILVGDIVNSRVAAYLHASLVSVKEAKTKLEKAGFEILSAFKVDKKGKVVSIVFTNDAMKKAASKNIRGFAGSLRILLDKENKLTVIANPIYMMKAFMQTEYDEALAIDTLTSLRSIFEDAKNSQEMIKFSVLERFRFMENMPYYQDMKQVAEGKNQDLLKKAKKSKKVVYVQHLENGSILLGVELGRRTSKFVKKIGYQNSGLLPYPVLIENGKAKILAPQYYIAIMYPMLKMSQFMKIATVPGAIIKDVDKVFR